GEDRAQIGGFSRVLATERANGERTRGARRDARTRDVPQPGHRRTIAPVAATERIECLVDRRRRVAPLRRDHERVRDVVLETAIALRDRPERERRPPRAITAAIEPAR